MVQHEEHEDSQVGMVILSLGSNLGDRVRWLERGLERLSEQVRLESLSSIYETQPVGVRDQPWFLNMVCAGVTRLSPRGVLEFILEVEDSLGREREHELAPRNIDIDLLAYDDKVIDEPELQLPHPRMTERAFVLRPLAEIAPDWRHPVEGKTAPELLEELDGEIVRPYSLPPPTAGPAPLL